MTLEAWLNWFYLVHHVIESSNWSLVLFSSQCQVKTMKSKYYNIQVSFSSCEKFIGNICWLANLFVLNLAFGWTIFLQIEKWVKCHLLLKCGLKTSTYDIWFLCALFASNFLFFQSFYGLFMSFLDFTWFIFDFSFLLTHMSLWMVFMLVLWFLEFYLSNGPNSKLKLWRLEKFWAVWILVVRTVCG